MISIDRQPWAHRGGPAFVTSKLNPIADPRRSLMNWPCSPSLFNWWCVPFQVDHHYVPRMHWFSKTPPPLPKLLSPAFFKRRTAEDKPDPTLTILDFGNVARGASFKLLLTSQLDFQRWIYSGSLWVQRPAGCIDLKALREVSRSRISQRRNGAVSWQLCRNTHTHTQRHTMQFHFHVRRAWMSQLSQH